MKVFIQDFFFGPPYLLTACYDFVPVGVSEVGTPFLALWLYLEVWTLPSRVIVSWGMKSLLALVIMFWGLSRLRTYGLLPLLAVVILWSHHEQWISKSWTIAPGETQAAVPGILWSQHFCHLISAWLEGQDTAWYHLNVSSKQIEVKLSRTVFARGWGREEIEFSKRAQTFSYKRDEVCRSNVKHKRKETCFMCVSS